MTPKRCRQRCSWILSLLVILSISLAVVALLPAVSADTDDIVTTNASVNPEEIRIGDTTTVTLTVNSTNETEKVPVDVMHVIDKSGSMNWYGDVILHHSSDTLTTEWTNIGTFNVDSPINTFDVLLETGSGSTTTQYLNIKNPSGKWYGYYGNISDIYPLDDALDSGSNTYHQYPAGADYIGIYDSDDVENGPWEVYAKGYGVYDGYDLSVQVPPIRLEAVQDAAKTFVGLMGDDDQIGVVYFDSTGANCNEQLTLLKNDVNDTIDSLTASTYAPPKIDAGIKAANKEFYVGGGPNTTKMMVLLSNGVNTAGREDAIKEAEKAADLANPSERTKIFTIGFGEADHELLKEIANVTRGEYYYAANGSDLQEIYETISEEITGLSSRNYAFYVLPDDVEYAWNATIAPEIIGNTLLWGIDDLAPGTPWTVSFDLRPTRMGKNISLNEVQYSGVSYALLGTIDETTKVTTGGNIKNPKNWTIDDPDTHVTFGFVVQYKKGEAWPEGNLVLQDHTTGMILKAESMEILAVAENSAVFRGTATVNGTSGYEFIVSVEKNESGDVIDITITGPGNFSYRVKGTLTGGSIQVDPGSSEYVQFPALFVDVNGFLANNLGVSAPDKVQYIGQRVPVTGYADVDNTGSEANISVTLCVDYYPTMGYTTSPTWGQIMHKNISIVNAHETNKNISVSTTWIPMSSGRHSVSIHVYELKDDGTEFWLDAQGPNTETKYKTIYIKKVIK